MQADSNKVPTYRTIQASEFKAKCLELMDEVEESGEEIVITKQGRPVSRLVPYREKAQEVKKSKNLKSPFGADRGKIKIHGDIVGPMPAEWFTDGGSEERLS